MAAAAARAWSRARQGRPAVVAAAEGGGGGNTAASLPPGARRRARARLQKQKQKEQQQQPNTPINDNNPKDDLHCPYALSGTCSGCSLTQRHAIAAPPAADAARRFFDPLLLAAGNKSPFTVLAGPTHGWRCRARLAVRWADEHQRKITLGLFRAGSHAIGPDLTGTEPRSVACPVHHPLINEAIAMVKTIAEEMGVEPYDEETRGGALRYVQATVVGGSSSAVAAAAAATTTDGDDLSSLGVQLVLVVNASAAAKDESADGGGSDPQHQHRRASVAALAAELWRRAGDGKGLLHSIRVNCQPRADSNAVLGPEWLDEGDEVCFGPEFGWVALGPPPGWAAARRTTTAATAATAAVAPGGFTQANQEAMRAAAAAVAEAALAPLVLQVGKKKTTKRPVRSIVDLFAGAGALGLVVAAEAAARREDEERSPPPSVECVEINARCAPAFRAARQALPSAIARQVLAPELRMEDCCTSSGGGSGLAALWRRDGKGVDVAIVDPPRKGLGLEMVEALTTSGESSMLLPRRLVYLSCGWAALRRDAAALMGLEDDEEGEESGNRRVRWSLASARAFVFFPGTDAIETLCVFEREGGGGEDGGGSGGARPRRRRGGGGAGAASSPSSSSS
jgi:tRNA/tmRNA/rRNA uracil-C5-methylase (TrmA/RlmC/RlmD family)